MEEIKRMYEVKGLNNNDDEQEEPHFTKEILDAPMLNKFKMPTFKTTIDCLTRSTKWKSSKA